MNKIATGSHKIQIRLSAKRASLVSKALKMSADADSIVREWNNIMPHKGMTPNDARNWAERNVHFDSAPMSAALEKIYSEGWVLGTDTARAFLVKKSDKALYSLRITKEATTSVVDWETWTAGNRPAAILLNPPSGLHALMTSRSVSIKGINATTADRIGTALANALETGASPSSTVSEINSILQDPERALMIAQTEMSRATSVASRNEYENTGVEYVEWLVADGCDICQENQMASPIPITDTFPSGDTEPPAHPNCMCSLSPYVVSDTGITGSMIDGGSLDDGNDPTLNSGYSGVDSTDSVSPADTALLDTSQHDLIQQEAVALTDEEKKYLELKPLLLQEANIKSGFQRRATIDSLTAEKATLEEVNALASYSGGGYGEINSYWRTPEAFINSQPRVVDSVVKRSTEIDNLMARAPLLTEDTLTFRGYQGAIFGDGNRQLLIEKIKNLKVGEIFVDKGYTSTSLRHEVAAGDFHNEHGVIIEIVNPKGTRGIMVKGFFNVDNGYTDKEYEWLLPRTTNFKTIYNDGTTIRVVAVDGNG